MTEIEYNGFKIEIEKVSDIVKNSLLYCSVINIKDGWYLFNDDVQNNISEQVIEFKNLIDNYLSNAENWDFKINKPKI